MSQGSKKRCYCGRPANHSGMHLGGEFPDAGPDLEMHVKHGAWHQAGPLVICECGQKLYRGDAPATRAGRMKVADKIRGLRRSLGAEYNIERSRFSQIQAELAGSRPQDRYEERRYG